MCDVGVARRGPLPSPGLPFRRRLLAGLFRLHDAGRLRFIERPARDAWSGMVTANSMTCLIETLGSFRPGNGSPAAIHVRRGRVVCPAAAGSG